MLALAEALLAEGILKESDWTGNLRQSLEGGIARWTVQLLGGQDLRRIELGLLWTDDAQAATKDGSVLDTRLWCEAVPGRNPEEPVGLLALVGQPRPAGERYPHERDCLVGETVRELERHRPGLGFQVLALLSDVLPVLIGTATPHYGYHEARKYADLGIGLLTPERYCQVVPLQACVGKPLTGDVLRKARGLTLPARLAEIVSRAVDVLNRWEALRSDAKRCDAHLLASPEATGLMCAFMPGHAAKLSSFSLRWSERDALPQVVDDYYRQLQGRGTHLLWCRGWQLSDPESLRAAVRHWRAVVACALRACALAELMHAEEAP